MQAHRLIEWKSVPAARLLAAFVAGIMLQWYAGIHLYSIVVGAIALTVLLALFSALPGYKKFRLQWVQGLLLLALVATGGAVLTFFKNVQNHPLWYGRSYPQGTVLIGTVEEPLVTKPNSYKTVVKITGIYRNKTVQQATGQVLVYFKKDSSLLRTIGYGTQIAFARPVQSIQNTGNPGGFDYRRYLLFQGVTAQVYLQPGQFAVLSQNNAGRFGAFLQSARAYAIATLQRYISGSTQQGVAEALLIGYRNDLDKELVQAYSRTGVVHIIAISGLHLGMIYGVLLLLFSPFKNRRWYRAAMPVTVLTVLWLFSFIAGAVPSIVRSAVMFSFIVLGECLRRKPNIYNTLAASALCLLIANPFYLWDVGFQLSYAAVLSIVVFMKPIYRIFYFENAIINFTWKLLCTTLAAQILTLPVVLFYFHQFPLLFMVSNLLVVPLSLGILLIEIGIIVFSFWDGVAFVLGRLANALLWLMNSFIQQLDKLPFAVWENIKWDLVQVFLAYCIIGLLMAWLLGNRARMLLYALFPLLLFSGYTAFDMYKAKRQQRLVVYHVPRAAAIDLIQGTSLRALSTPSLLENSTLQNFYLQPTRLQYRATPASHLLVKTNNYLLQTNNKKVLIVGKELPAAVPVKKIQADVIIVTGNPKLTMSALQERVSSPVIVFDATNPNWKIDKWKKECNHLHLRFHSVAQQGAFQMEL